MREQAEGRGERGDARDGDGRGDCALRGTEVARAIGTRGDIPVFRHGVVPPIDEEPAWGQIEPGRQRTIADSGGAAVLLAALATAAIAGLLLYLH